MKKAIAVLMMLCVASVAFAFVVDPGDILIGNNNWMGTSTIDNIDPVTGDLETISLSGDGYQGLQWRLLYYDSAAYPAWTGKIIASTWNAGTGEYLRGIDPATGVTTVFSNEKNGSRTTGLALRPDGKVLNAYRYVDNSCTLVDPSDGSQTVVIGPPGGTNIWTDIAMDPLDGTGQSFFAITNWQTNPGLSYWDGATLTTWTNSGYAGHVEVDAAGKIYVHESTGTQVNIYEISRAAGHAATLIAQVDAAGASGFDIEADGNFVVSLNDGAVWSLDRITANPGDPGSSAVGLIRAGISGTPNVVPGGDPGVVIPEPAGLGLVGLALLAVRKRRS